MEFLATYLQFHPLPENVQSVSPVGFTVLSKGSFPLRHRLLNWILPVDEESDGTNEVLTFWAGKTAWRY